MTKLTDDVRRAILDCADRRVQVRQVPRGFRVSLPTPAGDGHLVELSVFLIGKSLRVGDGGEFQSLVDRLEVPDESTAVEDALAEFSPLGFSRTPDGELVASTTKEDIGCLALDFAAAWLRASILLAEEGRTQPKNYETHIWRALLDVREYVQRDVTLAGVEVPFYAKNAHAAAVAVGSYGATVSPVRVATLQLSPLYRLLTHDDTKHLRRIAIVKDDYAMIPEIESRLDEIASTVLESDIARFRRMARGESTLDADFQARS